MSNDARLLSESGELKAWTAFLRQWNERQPIASLDRFDPVRACMEWAREAHRAGYDAQAERLRQLTAERDASNRRWERLRAEVRAYENAAERDAGNAAGHYFAQCGTALYLAIKDAEYEPTEPEVQE